MPQSIMDEETITLPPSYEYIILVVVMADIEPTGN